MRQIAELTPTHGAHRWVGVYEVDRAAGMVRDLVWSGTGTPEYPTFLMTKGLIGSASAERRAVNVADVASDPRYLTAFGSTRSEIIVPIFDRDGRDVVGTIDVGSGQPNAFDAAAQDLLEECERVIRMFWDNSGTPSS
ncbi:MAG TPA: GAF domain-containing protein [Candidatus Acidoferrum sp.]|nr:GAF domain-containing protein [Candidatus Acidoferrum sp.]